MNDSIERLRSFVVEREKIACGSDIVTACNNSALRLSDLRALLAALEAAREDAERLDWLDANGSAVRLKGNSRRNLIIWGAVHVPSYRTIRHAIDHARGEEVDA